MMGIIYPETVLATLLFMEMIVRKDHVYLGLRGLSTQILSFMNVKLVSQDSIFHQMKLLVRNVILGSIKMRQDQVDVLIVLQESILH